MIFIQWGLHYFKHEKNYLNKLNDLLNKNNYNYQYSLVELFFHVNDLFNEEDKDEILFNLEGVLNHNLYFKGINAKNGIKPNGKLLGHLEKTLVVTKIFGDS